jgi:hypothetical protein
VDGDEVSVSVFIKRSHIWVRVLERETGERCDRVVRCRRAKVYIASSTGIASYGEGWGEGLIPIIQGRDIWLEAGQRVMVGGM